jgi:hypothetical protein
MYHKSTTTRIYVKNQSKEKEITFSLQKKERDNVYWKKEFNEKKLEVSAKYKRSSTARALIKIDI